MFRFFVFLHALEDRSAHKKTVAAKVPTTASKRAINGPHRLLIPRGTNTGFNVGFDFGFNVGFNFGFDVGFISVLISVVFLV